MADVNGLRIAVEQGRQLAAPAAARSRLRELARRVSRAEDAGQEDSAAVTELAQEAARLEHEYSTVTGYYVTAEFSGDLPFASGFYPSLDTVCAELARRGLDAGADYWRPDPDAGGAE